MKTLGLDLGPNSIGWAWVEDDDNTTGRLIDCGVRVFPEGVDAFDTGKESSRNEQRRTARMMRRQIRRRARRRRVVQTALIETGLLPADDVARKTVLATDPYPLRAAGVERRLEPFEIGRIIYHLNQRRGFLSLKKISKDKVDKELKAIEKKRSKAATSGEKETTDAKDDDSKMLASIELLAKKIGDRTLGQTLFQQQSDTAGATPDGTPIPARIRNQHTRRAMIEDEFLRVWSTQRAHHPTLLTDLVCFGQEGRQDAQRTRAGRQRDRSLTLLGQFGLHGLIFHQRPIYWPREMIGMCELEKGHRRCPRADRRSQRFRMLQEINNLRYTSPGRFDEKNLDDEQRSAVLKKLYSTDRLTFDQLRKLLGLIDGVKFNLERGERASIKGCEPDVRLVKVWKDWQTVDDTTKDGIVRALIDAERDAAAARDALIGTWKLPDDVADDLLSVDLPDGYVGFSLKAINKLMPHLEQGMILASKADGTLGARKAAGYDDDHEIARRLLGKLPRLEMIRTGPLSDLPNPVVRATMHELRRVVNAIVREYGPPDSVHVEMARSLKMNSEKRKKYNRSIQDRGRERADVADLLRNSSIAATRDAILKYRLWQEQQQRCIYTGRSISFQQLYNGSTDIDHILPYSLTLDDSQTNKVVVYRDANMEKGQRSPYEWLAGSDPERLKQIEQWGECLTFNKRRKLVQQEIKTDDFIARQLVDTGYITRLAVVYLEMLVEKKHDVQGRKGTYTADLRHHWGLKDVISTLPHSPAWHAKADGGAGEKNRADHRHHALDAIVIALTNRRTLAAMHQGKEMVHHLDKTTGEVVEYQRFKKEIPPPWGSDAETFRAMVAEKLRTIHVSHRVRRGVNGGLHEETNYGPVFARLNGTERKARRIEHQFVVRKAVENLSPNEIEKIRDESIRKIVIKRLEDRGISFGRGVDKIPPKLMQQAMTNLTMPSGVPIRKVRLLKEDQTIRPLRHGKPDETWVKPGSTHHLCLFEWDQTSLKGKTVKKRDALFVSMLEARQRIREQFDERARLVSQKVELKEAQRQAALSHPIIRRVHPDRPDARFVMSLSPGHELVLAKLKGHDAPVLLYFKTAASTSKQMQFAMATDARRSADQKPYISFSPATLDAEKITVDPLGRLRWAGD